MLNHMVVAKLELQLEVPSSIRNHSINNVRRPSLTVLHVAGWG
eukprot:CAMPEP_0183448720 /NCGR_PEP_ID=MMETSP0370-20130417/107334_1 /TAXON_ID=268820 /ORGANISM="Peridinium aciculiferum, Strain PAER-2" /LENGTH=42 /DNA_ID= /DNA_START= /DNA_END= /DNA_ORIENTATION=